MVSEDEQSVVCECDHLTNFAILLVGKIIYDQFHYIYMLHAHHNRIALKYTLTDEHTENDQCNRAIY